MFDLFCPVRRLLYRLAYHQITMKPKPAKARVMTIHKYLENPTQEAYLQMVEQGAKGMYQDDVGFRRGEISWENLIKEVPNSCILETFRSRARAFLAAIGIKEPKK